MLRVFCFRRDRKVFTIISRSTLAVTQRGRSVVVCQRRRQNVRLIRISFRLFADPRTGPDGTGGALRRDDTIVGVASREMILLLLLLLAVVAG